MNTCYRTITFFIVFSLLLIACDNQTLPPTVEGDCLLESIVSEEDYQTSFEYNSEQKVIAATATDGYSERNYTFSYDAQGMLSQIIDFGEEPGDNTLYHQFFYNDNKQLIKIAHSTDGISVSYFDSLIYVNGKLKYDYLDGEDTFYMEYFWERNNIVKEVQYYEGFEPFELEFSYDNANKFSSDLGINFILFDGETSFMSGRVFSNNNPIYGAQSYTYNSKDYPSQLFEIVDEETTVFQYLNCN